MYDAIIIGAGPAGCAAAKTLADRGHTVLLIEKCRLPRYKSCSGQLIRKSLELVQAHFGEATPESALCLPHENRGMVFTDDSGSEYRFEQSGLNVWRGAFDQFLAQKAVKSGAELREETYALRCEEHKDKVAVTFREKNTYTETARYVIDCEGAAGSFKRKLTGAAPDFITTFQTYNRGAIQLDPHYFYAYLQPELSEYDAWFNVKDQLLVLGVSVKNPANARLYHRQFLQYMTERHGLRIEALLKEDRWLMPRVRPGCPIDYHLGRVFFAGEAAGFLNPMGEGVSSGIESGFHAACAISAGFHNAQAAAADYRLRAEPLRAYMRRQWDLVGRMAKSFEDMRI